MGSTGLPAGLSPILPRRPPVLQRRTVETLPQKPTWIPYMVDAPLVAPYELHDPRTFFVGAPSSYMHGSAATFLQNKRREARSSGKLDVHYRDPLEPPEGVAAIMKTERAILPDGTIYEMEATWVKDPRFRFRFLLGCVVVHFGIFMMYTFLPGS